MRTKLAVRHERAKRVDDATGGEEGGNVRGVVRRRDFDDLHSAKPFLRHPPDQPKCLARQEASRFRPSCSWDKAAIDGIDVEAHIDRVRILPGDLQRDLGDLVDDEPLHIGLCDDRLVALPSNGYRLARTLPSADADLDEIAGRDVRQIGRMKPRRRVHPLVQVFLLDVRVAIEMKDADAPGSALCNAAHGWKAYRVIAAENYRQRPL